MKYTLFTILTIVNGFTNSNNAIRRNKLITNNIKLVHYIANNYKSSKNNENDLLQEGMYGLCVAADKFDPNRNVKFSTYSSYWIRGYILRHIYKDGLIRIPEYRKGEREHVIKHIDDKVFETLSYNYNDNTNIMETVTLSDIEKQLIYLRFDLKESYSTISRKYNITKYKVEKIYKKIFEKLSKQITID
tara:strand:+ start:33349 stop:33915 length:567 start_codon:yes stop_codon:yes gene_type:complete